MCSFPLGCIPDVSPKEKRIFLFDRQRSLNRRTGEKMGKSGPSYILNSSLAKSSCFLLLLILTSAWGQEFGIFNPMRSQITRFQVIFDNSLWAEGIPQQNICYFPNSVQKSHQLMHINRAAMWSQFEAFLLLTLPLT